MLDNFGLFEQWVFIEDFLHYQIFQKTYVVIRCQASLHKQVLRRFFDRSLPHISFQWSKM